MVDIPASFFYLFTWSVRGLWQLFDDYQSLEIQYCGIPDKGLGGRWLGGGGLYYLSQLLYGRNFASNSALVNKLAEISISSVASEAVYNIKHFRCIFWRHPFHYPFLSEHFISTSLSSDNWVSVLKFFTEGKQRKYFFQDTNLSLSTLLFR